MCTCVMYVFVYIMVGGGGGGGGIDDKFVQSLVNIMFLVPVILA